MVAKSFEAVMNFQLEWMDVISIFFSGLAIGVIAGHKLGVGEKRAEYERGRLDVLWELFRYKAINELAKTVATPGREASGGGGGSKEDS